MKHASKGASSAERWISCPGSLALIESLPLEERERGGKEAARGTAAHQLAEWCLLSGRDPSEYPLRSIEVEDHSFRVDDEVREPVRVYLRECEAARARARHPEVRIECRVQPLEGRADMFGTADYVVAEEFGALEVIDYKNGSGKLVEVGPTTLGDVDAPANPQLLYYGLGAARELGPLASAVERVVLTVVQPRAEHPDGPVRSIELSPEQLFAFGSDLRAAAERADEPGAPLRVGDHCGFCPARGRCPAQREEALALLDIDPAAPRETAVPAVPSDPEQLAAILDVIPRWDKFARAVEGAAQRLAEAGTRVPGYKLVRGRAGNRQWRGDEQDVAGALIELGLTSEEITEPPRLRSPSKIEATLKARGESPEARRRVVEPLVERAPGKLKLAPDSDGRSEEPSALDMLD